MALDRSLRLDHCDCTTHMRRMPTFTALYLSDHLWTGVAISSAVMVLVSSLADRKRNRRRDINAVGFMPWTAITVMSVLATVVSAALAIKGI
jgi:hypothetical protein